MADGLSIAQWLALSGMSATDLANVLDAYITSQGIHGSPSTEVEQFRDALRSISLSSSTLVVEDGTGKANADSYVSLSEAEGYFLVYPNVNWTADLSMADKESALRKATQDIDLLYRSQFAGVPKTAVQDLAFPRDGDTVISNDLKGATLELAALELGGLQPLLPSTEDTAVTEDTLEIPGAYKRTRKWGGGRNVVPSDSQALYRVRAWLQPLLEVPRTSSSFYIMPLVRG